jgi:hypothetical protein
VLSVLHDFVIEHKCISKFLDSLDISSNSRLRPPLKGGYGKWAVKNRILIKSRRIPVSWRIYFFDNMNAQNTVDALGVNRMDLIMP